MSASMADRYFVETAIQGDRALLLGTEAHHLAHVMRARPGVEVVLFDGSGAQFSAKVERVGRAEVELAVLARHEVDRELAVAITLGVPLPKGDRQRWLVEKAVELGVARLAPLATERSNDRETPATLKRLSRAVIEASKQCGRNRLMAIDPVAELSSFVAALAPTALGLIAQLGGPPLDDLTLAVGGIPRHEIRLLIGPEGGWTDAELELAAAAGWRAVGLGQRILRVETATLALVAAVTSRLGES
jgi:16S rRNA (uracil1498-N3)-methyltransferase